MASLVVLNVRLSLFLSLFVCLSANLYCLHFCLASRDSLGSIADSHHHHDEDELRVHAQKQPEAATTVRLSALPSVEKKLMYHNFKSSKEKPSSFRAAAERVSAADDDVNISLSDVLDLVLSAQLANSTTNSTTSNATSASDAAFSAPEIFNSSQSVADFVSPNSTVDLKNNQNNASSSSSLLSKQAVASFLSAILSSHRNPSATSPFHNATSSSSVSSSSSSNETHVNGSVALGGSSESTQSESGETDFLHALLRKKLDLLNSIGKKGLRTTLSEHVGAVVSRKQHWKKAFLKRKEERQKRRQQRRKDRTTAAAALRRRRADDKNMRPHKPFFWPFATDEHSQHTTRFGLEPLDFWFYSEDDENLFENDDERPFGSLSEEDYRELIESGDIEPVFWPEVMRGSQQFNGKWQADLSRSDSVDKLLQQLGFGLIKRRVIDSYPSLIKIAVDTTSPADEPSMWMQTVFPLGITKQAIVRFNGEEVEQPDSDTGLWYTKPYYINGRIIQRRVSPLGIMYDTRAIFASDPMGIFDGPTMLFKWTFIPKGKPPVVAMRWLRKLA